MFNVIYDGKRPKDRGQYYVEVINLTFNEDSAPEKLTPRLGFWCDVAHLRSLQRRLISMIGPPSNESRPSRYGTSDEEVIDEFVNLIGPLNEHKEVQSKHDMIEAIRKAKGKNIPLPEGKPFLRTKNPSGDSYTGQIKELDKKRLQSISLTEYSLPSSYPFGGFDQIIPADDIVWLV